QYNANDILQYAAAIQQNSEHYIAKGVLNKLKEKNLSLWSSSDFKYEEGVGVSGMVNGKKVVAAGPNYFKQRNKPLPEIPKEIDQKTETVNFVLIDNELAGI